MVHVQQKSEKIVSKKRDLKGAIPILPFAENTVQCHFVITIQRYKFALKYTSIRSRRSFEFTK